MIEVILDATSNQNLYQIMYHSIHIILFTLHAQLEISQSGNLIKTYFK